MDRSGFPAAEAFEIAKKESLVLDNRTAERATELVLYKVSLGKGLAINWVGVVDPGVGVECRIP